MIRFFAVIEDHKTEKKYAIGDFASKETAVGSLMIRMQLDLLEHTGGDSDVEFKALKTCGITDNGEDTLIIEANSFNKDTHDLTDMTGYVFRIGEEE